MSFEGDLAKALANAGVGAAIAFIVLIGLYRIANRLGLEFVRAQQAQADALGRQAQSMEMLKDSVRELVTKDNSEHREMLVLLRYIAQDHTELERVRREHDLIHKKESR